MNKGKKRQFNDEVKRQAVDDYVSGRKSAAEVAAELGIVQNMIYRWRAQFEAQAKGDRIDELVDEGHSLQQARKILQLEEELAEYKRKLAEQILINDLLKKLRDSRASQPESELTGLIATMKSSARRKGPAK
jgi:transposase-like protein